LAFFLFRLLPEPIPVLALPSPVPLILLQTIPKLYQFVLTLGHKRFVLAGKRGLCWRWSARQRPCASTNHLSQHLGFPGQHLKTENKQHKSSQPALRFSGLAQVAHFFA
jgi:hypothetical protein